MSLRLRLGLLCVGLLGLCGWFGGPSAEPVAAADEKVPTFKADVVPILKTSCVGCHGAGKKKGGVDVSTYEGVMKTVNVTDASKSELVMSVTGKGAKLMPPKKGLPDAQVTILKAWIAAGAKNN